MREVYESGQKREGRGKEKRRVKMGREGTGGDGKPRTGEQ